MVDIGQWQRVYFSWLSEQVKEEGHQRHTYLETLMLLHTKEFVWLVPNDDNRIQDGLDLRQEFLTEAEAHEAVELDMPCSVLEVLIGLSRRLAWQAEGSQEGWAWQLMVNLELHKMYDPLTPRKVAKIDELLERLIWRNYNPDGTGGFFPLSWPEEDQTKIELWYQMSAYVSEIHPEY